MIGSEPFALSHSLNSTKVQIGQVMKLIRGSLVSIQGSQRQCNHHLSFLGGFVGNCIFLRIVKARPINIDYCRAIHIVSILETLGKFLRTSFSSVVSPSVYMQNTFL